MGAIDASFGPAVGTASFSGRVHAVAARHIPVPLDPTPAGTGLGAFVVPILLGRAGEGEEKSRSGITISAAI